MKTRSLVSAVLPLFLMVGSGGVLSADQDAVSAAPDSSDVTASPVQQAGAAEETSGARLQREAGKWWEQSKEMGAAAWDATKEKSSEYYEATKDKSSEYYEATKDKGSEYYESAKEKGAEYYDEAKAKMEEMMDDDENETGRDREPAVESPGI